jgi:autotransporter-associated beta strand protein
MPSGAGGAQEMMLLSDGTVLILGGSDSESANWYKLTPNSTGSYINGTIAQVASMSVSRLFFTSDVLPSGKVFVLGGEYSGTGGFNNTGEIYDPVANSWSSITNFPQGSFGDDPSEVLPNGNVLAGYVSGTQTYIYNVAGNSWSQTGTKKNSDRSDEETWVKLPNNDILSYNIFASPSSGTGSAQFYNPATGSWSSTGSVPVPLTSGGTGGLGDELGPGFLLPDGRVFLIGANGNTVLYSYTTNTWTQGPSLPSGFGNHDGPGAELPNGHVLFTADESSPEFNPPTELFDFDPVANTLTQVTPTSPSSLASALNNNGAFIDYMLDLPNGDVLMSVSGNRLYEYTPSGSPNSTWQPTISKISYNGNQTYTLFGTQLNGVSEGANYGDDAEMASNYPIVRLTNTSTGAVFYARTFNWSSTGVQTGSAVVNTQFSLPATLPFANYSLTVIANGIASAAVNFTPPIYVDTHWVGLNVGTVITDADPVNSGNQTASIGTNAFATVGAAINAAPVGGLIIINGANGTSGSGVFTESVNVGKQVTIWLQQGAVAFNSLGGSVASANIILNDPLTVGADNTTTEYDGALIGPSGFTKTGSGTLTLTANESYTGATSVSGGDLLVSGSISSASTVTVAAGATLSGPGTIGGTTVVNGTLAPGNVVGDLTTGTLNFASTGTLAINVMGPTAGTNYSQVVSDGPVNLNSATLSLNIASGFTPAVNTPIDILVNDSGAAISGTFANLAEGATFSSNGEYFTISYLGGTSGHDIVLTATAPPVPPTVLSVQVNDGSAQRSEVTSITVTFSGTVAFAGGNTNAAAAFQLQHVQDTTDINNLNAALSVNGAGQESVTLSFTTNGNQPTEIDPISALNNGVPSLADGRYQLTILAANVTDAVNGLELDGTGAGVAGVNYVSPTDTMGGGPGQIGLYRLFGDATGNGVVDAIDFGQFRQTFNASVGDPLYLAYLDADNSGSVDAQDLGQFRARLNASVF